MNDISANNKRIAKNSVVLTIRLVITMCISLYTSRVILNALGIEDYGIYNVVGGLVGIFASLTDSLSRAFSRYITYAIAKGDVCEQRSVFSANINILVVVAVLVILFCEITGIWYFSDVANIPEDRRGVLNVVFQISLLSFLISILRIPNISLIIAHEHSGAYALIGILDALLKLSIVYLLSISSIDKLVFYCCLLAGVNLLGLAYTSIYCWHSFDCFKYVRKVPTTLYKDMIGFASWSFVGISARIFNAQGIVLIINKFCGVVANAAVGIVTQVEACTRQFVSNIAVAVNPQIVKAYSVGNMDYMQKLVIFSTKCFAFVVLLYAIPFSFEAEYILQLWLGLVPEYTANLLRLVFCSTLFIVMASPLEVSAQASGNIKKFQLKTSILLIAALPLVWLLLYYRNSIYTVYAALIIIYFLILVVQFFNTRLLIHMSFKNYFFNIVIRILFTTLLSTLIVFFAFGNMESSFWRLCLTSFFSLFSTTLIALTVGFSKKERYIVISLIKSYIKK